MSDVFRRDQGPTEVRAAVEVATDPWERIAEREDALAVGKLRLMGVYDDRQEGRFMAASGSTAAGSGAAGRRPARWR